MPRGPDGKRKRRYETVRGAKKQAQARMTQIEHTLNQGKHFEPTSLTVSEYMDMWMRDYAEISVRPRTLQGYMSIVQTRIKPAFGFMRLTDLEARQVQTYYASCVSPDYPPRPSCISTAC